MKIETLEKFIKITAEDGMCLTTFKDGDDILTYLSWRVMYAPLNKDNSNIREISLEENDKLLSEMEALNKI